MHRQLVDRAVNQLPVRALREKPVRITEKLSKAKPAIKKGGYVGGYPRSCFGQRFYLAPSCDQDTNVS